MNVIVPLGGLGTRFQNQGYTRPKPSVRVLGKEMILWVLDSLNLSPEDTLLIVFNPSFMCMGRFMEEVVQPRYPKCKMVPLGRATKGAAETVLIGLQALDDSLKAGRPCLLCDGDTFYTSDVVSKYRPVGSAGYNGTFVFEDTKPQPIYSYVRPRVGSELVEEIREKVKISDYANSGCYCFRDSLELERYCGIVLERGLPQLNQDGKGEFYVSGVIKAMLEDRIDCKMLQLETECIHVLGTPSQVEDFCKSRKVTVPRAHFVLHYEDSLRHLLQSPAGASPPGKLIPFLRCVHRDGHYITIATSQSKPANGTGGKLETTLEQHGVPWDELQYNTPSHLFMVSARSVDSSLTELEKELGFYLQADELSEHINGNSKRLRAHLGADMVLESSRPLKMRRRDRQDSSPDVSRSRALVSVEGRKGLAHLGVFGMGFLAGVVWQAWNCST